MALLSTSDPSVFLGSVYFAELWKCQLVPVAELPPSLKYLYFKSCKQVWFRTADVPATEKGFSVGILEFLDISCSYPWNQQLPAPLSSLG